MEKVNIQELKDKLRGEIPFSEQHGEGIDSISWTMQDGILISRRQANLFLDLLEEYK